MLVKATLAAVGLSAALHCALVVSLDFICVPAHPLALLSVALALAAKLVVLVLAEAGSQLSLLLQQLLDLVGECDVGEVETAVFVVVSLLLSRVAE